ncbi:hypothetical protein DRO37_07675 [Candidatus Bathyarchaeota archaeon]|nr:MAG: hypothetical protein DRO37_07675 [Candidatus Bathyarchaeota archaeon]
MGESSFQSALGDIAKYFLYRGNRLREISFPIGGIGTGCIGLAGNGRLIDWEIFNRPNKGSVNGLSHFAVKAEVKGEVLDARVLTGDLPPPYSGEVLGRASESFGFGPPRGYLAGLPHFKEAEFEGTYPIATLRFMDNRFPGKVKMTAFNPYIPLNDLDSSIPSAFFEIEIQNTSEETITYTICLSVQNPLPAGTTVNAYGKREGIRFIRMTSDRLEEDDVKFGEITIATDSQDVSYQEYWFRGEMFDSIHVYWRDFTSPGRLKNRYYPEPMRGIQDHSSLAAHIKIKPGEKGRARFVISWSFPNCYNYWNPEVKGLEKRGVWKNYYATVFGNSVETAVYCLKNWDRLYGETRKFRDSLFSSTLPPFVIDAISANISILKTPTVLRLEDGSLYGFEGCRPRSGCCEGSCMHVWSYAYAPAFLFPKLDRSMWDLHYKYDQLEDGRILFRLQLPLGRGQRRSSRAAVDGQFGSVIRAYLYWKLTGDDDWLRSNWDSIKRSIEYAWAETNEDKWDSNRDGVLEGRQHHTCDRELFGPNSWLNGFYLAALKAGAEMAEYLREAEKAKEYMNLFRRGKRWVDKNLFNGEYYHQLINLRNRSILEMFQHEDPNVIDAYWDDEHGEIKYQIGEGCGVDQVLAQWHANICGLGEIFNKKHIKKALKSIYKYNFKSMREFENPCRVFSLNDERGVVICEWPKGKYKPVIPIPYAEETWPGCEYAVASLMIQEGLIEEGLEIVKAVRGRFDGEKRNPWNEFECGSNYARSMSSYALLLALSGLKFDMVNLRIEIDPPRLINNRFRCFWCLGTGWGNFEINRSSITIHVQYGRLKIKILSLPFLEGREIKEVLVGGERVDFERCNNEIIFVKPFSIESGSKLTVQF